jgi:hypothetical protein
MYKKNFDSVPGNGIPCTSVTTLEKMIVESPCGNDIFLGCVPKLVDVKENPGCSCTELSVQELPFQRRIWISPKEGNPVYIYFQEDMSCEEQ